jgi:hypothetical protein
VGKCLWLLDGAVLNGDDISHLELRDRLNACKKFAESVNQRNLRRPIFEQTNKGAGKRDRQSTFMGHKFVIIFCIF